MPKTTVYGGASNAGAPSGAPDVSRETSVPAEPEPADTYAHLSYRELQAELKTRDLNAKGSAEELVQRLVEADELS